jgi:GT2 family glycosyltransferase
MSLVVIGPRGSGDNWVTEAAAAASLLGDRWEAIFVVSGALESMVHAGPIILYSSPNGLWDAMNEGLAVATGEQVFFVSPAQIPDPVTASQIIAELADLVGVDAVYFDDAPIGVQPAFVKPAFSPERLRSQDYWGTMVAYRRAFLLKIGAGRAETCGAELYDLALRSSRLARSVGNSRLQLASVAQALEGSWYQGISAREAGSRFALQEHLSETGGGIVEAIGLDGGHLTRRAVVGAPLVSIVIPTGGTSAKVRGETRIMVLGAVRSITGISTYTNFEFIFVVDETTPAQVRSELRAATGSRSTFVEWAQPFSFSGKMNLGVLHAKGEFVLLLNDDVELITADWIESMLSLAQLPQAGTVGAMLYYEDDTIQHAGHAYYRLDVTHIGLGSKRGARGPSDGLLVEREVAGNSAACCLIKRELFLRAGGFSPLLPGNFNDVDLCMKVSALGYTSYWTPHAELYHFESKSRDPRVSEYEVQTTWGRWEHLFYDSDMWPTDPHQVY